ncbi:conserved Plasmodium protein, unknown function [Plasmodium chabaudi chabaudi]|uniref:Uncharacterized protein n=1 Tax=Plasmodium chabaudi chabaudi TaxID=31271 RepID=A0A4V0K773_PLACU|nr:conserved Plasmodium protein, unknown function [Plasmodium chabaudi chabaudi]VTZ68917.1 conserved Plasmodium protein, unknown function [Plasmodium chabaudi chabaudi]|eukprot:XP_742940.2 conserved Plasmodium protein, unknown function [Plasmodium chabaudi chabaudi]
MGHNIFDAKKTQTNRKRNVIKVKNHKGKVYERKDQSERYRDILSYYKNEKKTNKFIDKRKNKKHAKKNMFNLNDDPYIKDKHISINDVGDTDDDSYMDNFNSKSNSKGKRKYNNSMSNTIQEKIEARKLMQIKKYEIKEKLKEFDEHFDYIKRNVLSLNNKDDPLMGDGISKKKKNKINNNEGKFKKNTENANKIKLGSRDSKSNDFDAWENANQRNKKRDAIKRANSASDVDSTDNSDIGDGSDGIDVSDDMDDIDGSDDSDYSGSSDGSDESEGGKRSRFKERAKCEYFEKLRCDNSSKMWWNSDESDNEVIEEIFMEYDNSNKLNSEEIIITDEKDKVNSILENFMTNGNNELYNYFINNTEEEEKKIPLFISIEKKKYELKDIISLLEPHDFSIQKKLLYRIYFINICKNSNKYNWKHVGKKNMNIHHVSFFFSLMDYCILNIWKCLNFNLKFHYFIQNYKEVILDYSRSMKTELYLYMSFLLLILFCKIQRKIKTTKFYKKKLYVLQEYVELNKDNKEKEYDVYVYSRILESVELFNSIFDQYERCSEIYDIHFSVILLALIIYPIARTETSDSSLHRGSQQNYDLQDEKEGPNKLDIENGGNCENKNEDTQKEDEENTISQTNVNYIEDDELLKKLSYINKDNTLEENNETIPIISYVIELVEFIFYNYLYDKNNNINHDKASNNYDYILSDITYASNIKIEECVKKLGKIFSYQPFSFVEEEEKVEYDNETNEQENEIVKKEKKKKKKETGAIINNLGIYDKKKKLKNAIILLNIYNIIIENSKKHSHTYLYLCFRILNTLLFNIVSNRSEEEGGEKDGDHINLYYSLSFSTFNSLIYFLKKNIENDINIYILMEHIVIPNLFYLYINYLSFLFTNTQINYLNILEELQNVQFNKMCVPEDIIPNNILNNFNKNSEKYFAYLLYIYKIIEYSKTFDIKPIIYKNTYKNGIPQFTPKYANNKNPKDFLFMQNYQTKLAEMKSMRKKMRQQRKLDYNELRKENSYIIGLKAREEQERIRRNQEKYKKIKQMAVNDVEEYNRMKTYTH